MGSGVAGLAAARHLHRHAKVTVFEKSAELGGHVRTINHNGLHIDCGFIVFNRACYPGLTKLFAELGVRSQPSQMSFGVSAADDSFSYSTRTLRTLYPNLSSLRDSRHHRMVIDIVQFLARARRDHRLQRAVGLTLEEYLRGIGARPRLCERFVFPLAGALWSAGQGEVHSFPAEVFLGFLQVHGMLRPALAPPWRTVVGGAQTYVNALRLALDQVTFRTSCGVDRIRRDTYGVHLDLESAETETFDRVVLCTHADQALAMLDSPHRSEVDSLGRIGYCKNQVVVHTDERALPENRHARAAWNYRVSAASKVSLTYWSNKLQRLPTATNFLVTLNPLRSPRVESIVHETTMRHPQFNLDALIGRRQLGQLQGQRATYFAGAYFGFGFHEDGYRSGFAAAAKLLADQAAVAEGGAA